MVRTVSMQPGRGTGSNPRRKPTATSRPEPPALAAHRHNAPGPYDGSHVVYVPPGHGARAPAAQRRVRRILRAALMVTLELGRACPREGNRFRVGARRNLRSDAKHDHSRVRRALGQRRGIGTGRKSDRRARPTSPSTATSCRRPGPKLVDSPWKRVHQQCACAASAALCEAGRRDEARSWPVYRCANPDQIGATELLHRPC